MLLDGLDEGLSDIPGLDRVLLLQLRALSELQREGLRLRITCRTTRWPETLESGLRGLWPNAGQVALMTLEPLTWQDVESAAGQRGLEGAAFAEQVSGRGLVALAEQPVTLIPLVEAQAEGEELPKTVAEAYDQACRRLCTETWPQGFVQRQERPAVDHLLEVARWAAAALQFGRSPALTDREPILEGELHLDGLSGPAILGVVPQLECRRRELLHLTESALLTPVGQRRWVFAHRSYQEHLAAQYLRDRIAPAVRSELLWAGSGPVSAYTRSSTAVRKSLGTGSSVRQSQPIAAASRTSGACVWSRHRSRIHAMVGEWGWVRVASAVARTRAALTIGFGRGGGGWSAEPGSGRQGLEDGALGRRAALGCDVGDGLRAAAVSWGSSRG